MTHAYDDIIHMERPISKKHPPMSRESRAAQFAPFAALVGYEDAIRETARLTDRKADLTEDEVARINRVLEDIHTHRDFTHTYEITYFEQDARKQGGAYITAHSRISDINPATGCLTLSDRRVIAFSDILRIQRETKE